MSKESSVDSGIEIFLSNLHREEELEEQLNNVQHDMKKRKEIEGILHDFQLSKLDVSEKGKYPVQIKIRHNSTGYSYETIFGKFLDNTVTSINIEEPWTQEKHQLENLERFCEVFTPCIMLFNSFPF